MAAAGDWDEGAGDGHRRRRRSTHYVDRLLAGYAGGAYRIGWDAGNGAAGPVIEKLVKLLPGEHHTLYTEVDGNFPNHHPDPDRGEEPRRSEARWSREKKLDFGIAFDGDGDRIGAVDGAGPGDLGRPAALDPRRAGAARLPGATIIADVKASQALFDRIAELGGKPLMWKTGHSLIKTKMKETGAPLAGEMCGPHLLRARIITASTTRSMPRCG